MFALFAIRSLSAIDPIPGCTDQNKVPMANSMIVTKTIAAGSGESICVESSVLIKADKDYTVNYKFDDAATQQNGELKSVENPVLVGSLTKLNKIKITPKNAGEAITITLIGVPMSQGVGGGHYYGVFSTLKNMEKKMKINMLQGLALVATNAIPLKFTITSEKSDKIFMADLDLQKKIGNSISLSLSSHHDDKENTFSSEEVTIKCEPDPSTEAVVGYTNPFGEDIFYILPEEGAHTLEQITTYTEQHMDVFNGGGGNGNPDVDPDDLPEGINPLYLLYTLKCATQMDVFTDFERNIPKSEVVSLNEGEYKCVPSAVFASNDEFKLEMYNFSSNDKNYSEFNKPFSAYGDEVASIIKCKDEKSKCKVHYITIKKPEINGTVHAIFTTKNKLDFDQEVQVSDDSSDLFTLTVHSLEKKQLTIGAEQGSNIYYHLYNSDKENKASQISGTTIAAYPMFADGMKAEKRQIYVEIEESKSGSEQATESLFQKDIIYEIPEGTKTEEEVKSHSKESKINAVKNKGGLGTGAIVAIVVVIVIIIVIVCVLVWFFVFRKKSGDKKSSGSGEKV